MEKIIEDYQNGLDGYELAKKYNISKSEIYRILERNGIKRRSRKIILPKEELEELYVNQGIGSEKIGKIYNCDHSSILKNLKRYNIPIKSYNFYKKEKSPNWTGCGELSGKHWKHILSHAIKGRSKEIQVNITIQDAWNQFIKQNRKCALTGLELKFGSKQLKEETTASLDRIDSKGNYTIDNVQWLHKAINRMKWDLSQDDFLYYCSLIVQNMA